MAVISAKVVGNRGSYFRGGAGGVGIENQPDGSIGWSAVIGPAGSVAYLSSADVNSVNKQQSGFSFQAKAGATIDFTLANSGMAKDPDPAVQAGVPWANTLTVAAGGTIVFSDFPFSCIRVTLTGAGECYIVSH